jgi:two-component sensor histidine kinase
MSDYKESQRGLRKALQEKEQLMKELNHRVKNNLNMVASLINLKEGDLPKGVDLSDLQNQIDAIRTVHEKLAQTEGALSINMKSYLSDLLDAGFHWPQAAEPPRVETEVEETILPAKTAAAVGLIVNELATNAAKHGFPGTANPRLSVAFHHDREAAEYELTVSNSGKRFPDRISPDEPATGGLGLQLISAMVETLDGRITLQREPETTISIRLPSPDNREE